MTDHRRFASHQLRVLLVARVVNRLGAFTLPFLMVVLTTEFDASIGTAGLVLTVFGLATIPSRLAGGRLSDRIGPRRTIVLGLTGCAAGQIWLAVATGVGSAIAAVCLLGLVFEVYEPPSQALVAELVPAEDRSSAYGLFGAALAVAGVGAGLLAALLAGAGLRWLFVADAVTCLLCALLVAIRLPAGHRRQAGEGTGGWRDRRLLVMLAAGTVFATVYLQLMTALPLTLQARGLPLSGFGLIVAVSALTMIVAQRIVRIRDDFRAMTIGYAVLATGLLLTAPAGSLPALLAATVVWSTGDLILLGRTQSIVAGLAPPGARGRYLATYGTSWGIAAALGPLAGTQLLAHAGPTTLWLACAASTAALAAAQPLVRRVCRSDVEIGGVRSSVG